MGSPDMTLNEINRATSLVREVVQPNANIIFGADIRESMKDEIIVTMIATGFDGQAAQPEPQPAARQQRPSATSMFDESYNKMFDQRFGEQHPNFGSQQRPANNGYPAQPAPQARPESQTRGSRVSIDEDDTPSWMHKMKR